MPLLPRRPRSSLLVGALLLCGCGSPSEPASAQSEEADSVVPEARKTWLTVSGNQLLDRDGHPTRLLGVNHDGAEYMCAQGRGIFDSPADGALADAIASWRVNAVRVSLNEQCWLGVAGLDPRYSGDPYRRAITRFVTRLRARGLYVILEVHLSSSLPGGADRARPMLDRTYGLPFWRSVAQTFAHDRGVVFDAFNEPFLDTDNTRDAYQGDVWQCWRWGCQVTHDGETYISAGMENIVYEIRQAGALNVVMIGGLNWSNDLSGMLSHWPHDGAGATVASFHVYDFTSCRSAMCWNMTVGWVASRVPVVTGEIGESDCGTSFIKNYMQWADARGLSYLGWTFNPGDCGGRPSLVTDWSGTPTPYGAGLRDHLAAAAR
jgi:endoglucanase